ncbi:hypothetical protein SUGI_1126390 [Cryptomeria japonica]|nr:hypothetical protein SUGI_1126390 [Cryptomeria japonica]
MIDALLVLSVKKRSELELKSSTDAHNFQEGNTMFKIAVENNLKGISGRIAFRENGLLEVDSYDIINIRHIQRDWLLCSRKCELAKKVQEF